MLLSVYLRPTTKKEGLLVDKVKIMAATNLMQKCIEQIGNTDIKRELTFLINEILKEIVKGGKI